MTRSDKWTRDGAKLIDRWFLRARDVSGRGYISRPVCVSYFAEDNKADKSSPTTPEKEHDYDDPFAPLLPAQKAEDLARLAPLLQNLATSRRGLMLSPFIAALPASLISDPARAIDPNERK